MSLIRSAAIEHARTMADATGATRAWPVAFVLLCADRVYDREWAGLLDAVPFYRWAVRTVTASSADATAGGVALTALDSGTGATAQRTYRALQALKNGQALAPMAPEQLDLAAVASAAPAAVYACTGTTLVVPGLRAGDVLTVGVNHRPPLVSTLEDTASVVWPDGADLIPLAEIAALMLGGKGGQQPGEADTLVALAEGERQQLYASLQRPTGGARQLVAGGTVLHAPGEALRDLDAWGEGF